MGAPTLDAGTNWVCVRCEKRYAHRPPRRDRRALVRVRLGACPPCAAHVRALCRDVAAPMPAELGQIVERLAHKMRFNRDQAPAGAAVAR